MRRTLFRSCLIFLLAVSALAPVRGAGRSRAAPRTPVVLFGEDRPQPLQVKTFEGSVYIPLNDIARWTGAQARWHPVSERVDLTFPGHAVQLFFGSDKYLLDDLALRLGHPTVKEKGTLWVPLALLQNQSFQRLSRTAFVWREDEATLRIRRLETETRNRKGGEARQAKRPSSRPMGPAPRQVATAPAGIRRIVIDPGHGGKDSGAIGLRGTEEKTMNLLLAHDLAEALRQNLRYEVVLTRTDDTFLPLQARTNLANQQDADLFISVHCNASLSSHLRGFEVYFLSEEASDPHAGAVARAENASLALEDPVRDRRRRRVESTLRSLVKNVNINESSELGSLLSRAVARRLSQPNRGVKQAAFYVLRGAEMPAILIESAFLSNKTEERLLRKPSYRRQLAKAIVSAIVEYDQRSRSLPQALHVR